MGINYNYLCRFHINKNNWLQCYLLILREVEPKEKVVGAVNLLIMFKIKLNSILKLQLKKICHIYFNIVF
jgi:hypothetical protein